MFVHVVAVQKEQQTEKERGGGGDKKVRSICLFSGSKIIVYTLIYELVMKTYRSHKLKQFYTFGTHPYLIRIKTYTVCIKPHRCF